MSKFNTVHISHNLLLIHQLYHYVSFSKNLKKQQSKNHNNHSIQNGHRDFHYNLFKFPQA